MDKKVEMARRKVMSRQNLHAKLQDFLLAIDKNGPFFAKKFPQEDDFSLVAMFDNGIDPDPAFSGSVLSRIYLEKGGDLTLVLWPICDETTWRKEVLLANVNRFAFQFFGLKRGEDGAIPSKSLYTWHSRWSEKREEFPLIVKLQVWQKGSFFEELFFFPSSTPPTYFEGGGES